MDTWKKPFVVACALAFSGAIIVPVLFGEPFELAERSGGDPWRNAIYDFQTLITGLLAAAAAVVTVYFIRRQIDIAQMQARDEFSISLRRTKSIAKNGRASAMNLLGWVTLHSPTPADVATEAGHKLFIDLINELEEAVCDEVFTLIEGEIGYPSRFGARFVRNSVREFKKRRSYIFTLSQINDSSIATTTLQDWKFTANAARVYASDVRAICENFLDEADTLLKRYS